MSVSATVRVNDGMSKVLRHMNKALNLVIDNFNELQSATNASINADTIEEARLELTKAAAEAYNLESGMKGTGKAVEEANDGFTVMKGIVANIASNALMRVLQYLQETASAAVEYASDLTEVQNVVDVSFGENASKINEWSKTTLQAFGLNELSAKRYASTMGAMLNSAGLTGDAVLEMSQNLTQLAGDMASFYNLSGDEAFAKIRSGISGESEPLKQLGIDMTETGLAAFAQAQGISKSVSSMTMAEKEALRYQYLLQQTSNAMGDFTRTGDSYANQTKKLKESWLEVTGQIASGVLPALTSVVSFLNSMIKVVAVIGKAFQIIFNVASVAFTGLAPLIISAIALLSAYFVVTKGIAIAHAIASGAMTAFKVAQDIVSLGYAVLTGQTGAASAATLFFNSALMASPLTWIILIIVAVIALFYGLIAVINKLTGSSISATGIIMGAVYSLFAYVANIFIKAYNIIADFINFFGNVFNDPVASVKLLFLGLADTVIGYVLNMAKTLENVINKIPGVSVDITSGLEDFQKQVQDTAAKVKSESDWVEIVEKKEYLDYADMANKGYNKGAEIGNNVSDFFSGASVGLDMPEYMVSDWDTLVGGVEGINSTLDVAEEDLQYIKDIAEQEAINQFTTAEIKIDMNNNNQIASNMDIDGIVSSLEDKLYESMSKAAEGAF